MVLALLAVLALVLAWAVLQVVVVMLARVVLSQAVQLGAVVGVEVEPRRLVAPEYWLL